MTNGEIFLLSVNSVLAIYLYGRHRSYQKYLAVMDRAYLFYFKYRAKKNLIKNLSEWSKP